MTKHGLGHVGNVPAGNVEPTVQHRAGLAAEDQILASSRTGAPTEVLANEVRHLGARLVDARRTDEVHRVVDHVIGHGNLSHDFLQLDDLLTRQHGTGVGIPDIGGLAHDLEFLIAIGIVDDDFEHEAVLLGLGQRIGAFLLDGVLRGQHEERRRQIVPLATDGDLLFLHGLEKRGLRLGRRTVDLIRQKHVGEHRAGDELQLAIAGGLVLLDHVRAGDVRGHQVRRELDPAESQLQRLGQRADHQRLGDARHAFQNAVALAEHRDQQFIEDLLLSDDDLADLLAEAGVGGLEDLHGLDLALIDLCRDRFGDL